MIELEGHMPCGVKLESEPPHLEGPRFPQFSLFPDRSLVRTEAITL